MSALPKEAKDKLKLLSLSAVGHLERGNRFFKETSSLWEMVSEKEKI